MRVLSLPSKSLASGVGLFVVAALAMASSASALDLTGRWRVEASGFAPFADIVQTGNAVSVSVDGPPPLAATVFNGTVTGSSLSASAPNTVCGSPAFGLSLKIYGDEATLDGATVLSCGGFSATINRIFLSRCECDDGNLADGDGCDSHCRVESCYTCTGSPATCLPQSDGGACNDRNDCTTGETCTAGSCGGGAAAPGCLDVTGRWLVFLDSEFPLLVSSSVGSSLFRQENGVVVSRYAPDSSPGFVGPFTQSTRAMHLEVPNTELFCNSPVSKDITVDPGGITFEGSGYFSAQTPHGCIGIAPYTEYGYRCGGGVVDTGETCVVTSCTQCSGDPAVCSPLPDGTPCQNSDPCVYVAACTAGVCKPRDVVSCPNCSRCDSAGGCSVGARVDCLAPSDPSSSTMKLVSRAPATGDQLQFNWKKGPAFTDTVLGDPENSDHVSLCVFDESSASPSLLYQADLNPTGPCMSGPACWKDLGTKGWSFHDNTGSMSGIDSLTLRSGAAGRTSVSLRGKGGNLLTSPTGLPVPALPLPLRTQLQVEGGACFETIFGAAGVKKNVAGIFNAKGTP